MKDTIYGPKFKRLREEQNITQIQATKNITSKSALSRWENGSDNLSFSQVLKLLNRIHIQPIEFLKNHISPELHQLAVKIDAAYVKSDVLALHKYANETLAVTRTNFKNKDLFLKACIICNFYEDLSSDDLLSKEEKKRLNHILSNISNWNYKNIFCFCNSMGILDSQVIYRLSISLINYSLNEKLYQTNLYGEVINTVLNSISVLMRREHYLAEKLLSKIDQLKISDRFAFQKIYIRMYLSFLTYIKTKNNQDVLRLISELDFLNLPDIKDGVITGFKQIKKIYG